MALGPPIVGMPHPAMAGPASVVQAMWGNLTVLGLFKAFSKVSYIQKIGCNEFEVFLPYIIAAELGVNHHAMPRWSGKSMLLPSSDFTV